MTAAFDTLAAGQALQDAGTASPDGDRTVSRIDAREHIGQTATGVTQTFRLLLRSEPPFDRGGVQDLIEKADK